MRLQWALLWLAATARGEPWSPPEPGAGDEDPGAIAAAEAVMAGEPAAASAGSPAQGPEPEPERADGMTEI
jgi:hypothetical protein